MERVLGVTGRAVSPPLADGETPPTRGMRWECWRRRARAMRPRRAPSPMTRRRLGDRTAGTLSITVRRVSTASSVPGEDRAVDRRGEDDAVPAPAASRRLGSSSDFGRKARARDRDETSTGPQPRERGSDVPKGGVRHRAIDMGERRERRVHQHDAGRDRRIETIVDLRGVEAVDACGWKQEPEKLRPGLGEFVEAERRAPEFREDREQACSRRRLEDEIIRGQRGGGAGGKAQRDRGRELLQRLALGRAAGVGGQQRRNSLENRKLRRRGRHRARSAGAILRRNSTVAASQAS